MLSITRAQFRTAIEAGIHVASEEGFPVPADVCGRLWAMAETASMFGTNWTTRPVACPMGQLDLYDQVLGEGRELFVEAFVDGFDESWVNEVPLDWYVEGDVIGVVD